MKLHVFILLQIGFHLAAAADHDTIWCDFGVRQLILSDFCISQKNKNKNDLMMREIAATNADSLFIASRIQMSEVAKQ